MLWMPLLLLLHAASGQNNAGARQVFEVLEGAGPGTLVGRIGQGSSEYPQPPYFVVPADSANDDDLTVNQQTGEIRTRKVLDRERTREYRFSAIPLDGGSDSLAVVVRVLDLNDNAPSFPQSSFSVSIPENTPAGTRRKLPSAVDADGDVSSTKYAIVAGNEAGKFSLANSKLNKSYS